MLFAFLLFSRFLPPDPDKAVNSKVLVSFCGTRFPSFLGLELLQTKTIEFTCTDEADAEQIRRYVTEIIPLPTS